MTQIVGIATDSRNLDGRAQAITVLTRIKPGWTLWLRYNFFFGRNVPYFTKKLRMLSFIHYARWSIVTRIAENGPAQQPARLKYKYLLFTTNFNGTWDQYIDAFSEIVPWRIRMIWSSSFGFPGPLPAERFKDYIRKNEFVTNHYYAAYPQASTTQVLSALELRAKFERLGMGVPDGIAADDFRSAWLAFLTDVQVHL